MKVYYTYIPDRILDSIVLSPVNESVKTLGLLCCKWLYEFNLKKITVSVTELEALGIKKGMVGVSIHTIEKIGWFTFQCSEKEITIQRTEIGKYYNDRVQPVQNETLIEIGIRGKENEKSNGKKSNDTSESGHPKTN